MDAQDRQQCTRCMRTRRVQFMVLRTNTSGKRVWRCRKRSVCASKGRRLRATAISPAQKRRDSKGERA
jgi:hypothetical protein